MKRGLYIRLAATGISKNKKLYYPYILTCICMVMMYYIVSFLCRSEEFRKVPGAETLQSVLGFGVIVIGLFSLIFLYYTNSFLIRRRQKEFGLYNILGMGKRNLVKILLWENILTAAVSLVSGLACGVLLSKAVELTAARILGGMADFGFAADPDALADTAVLFAGIFFLVMLRMLVVILRSRPVEMLRSENVGEKPPKANWILAVLGLALLVYAYRIAVTIDDPVTAVAMFFGAVVLVIGATYLLFIAGSVTLCRMLQKKKSYYYKTKHFVSLSSMTYRMKRNGAGLASICILSTMVLVTVSSTSCLFLGTEEGLRQRYPRDIVVNAYPAEGESVDALYDGISSITEAHGVHMENVMEYTMLSVAAFQAEDMFYFDAGEAYGSEAVDLMQDIRQMYIFPLEDYNRLMGEEKTLDSDEVLLYTTKMNYGYDTISLENCGTWKVKENVPEFIPVGGDVANISSGVFLIVKDESVIRGIERGEAEIYGDNMSQVERCFGFDTDCGESEQIQIKDEIEALADGLRNEPDSSCPPVSVESREFERAGFYGLNGGLFFLGLLLGIVFLFGTVLIMYYKQISEGYEDQDRFDILMKVGMTRKEVKQSINSQVLTVFFLPLIVSGIHTAFAFPMISKMVVILGVTDQKFLIMVTAVCYLIFALFYIVIYLVTSREYFRIVSKKK